MKLLLCVDASGSSDKAVKLVESLRLGQHQPAAVTLFTVCESLPEHVFHVGASVGMQPKELASAWSSKSKSVGDEALAKAKAELVKSGIPEGSIETKVLVANATPESRQVAAAAGIIEEMNSGSYDLVVIGRRGARHVGDSLVGSVAEKVIRSSAGKSVLLVD